MSDRPPAPVSPPSELTEAKRASTVQVLFRCARLLNDHSLSRLRTASGQPVRPAHTNLFPHIDLEGTRLTELARRVGISKQAVGQLVAELEHMGTLERVPDPSDGRARLVRFARGPDGRSVLFHGLSVLRQVEQELAQELGVERWRQLRELLLDLEPIAEARAAAG